MTPLAPARDPAVQTEAVIEAPRQRVWDVFVDVLGWDAWNPTLFGADQPLREGAEVRMKLQLGPVKVPMRQQVRKIDPPREVVWRSRQVLPAAYDVIRRFRFDEAEAGRTRLVQSESVSGFLSAPITWLIRRYVAEGFENLARALARRVSEQPEGTG